MKNMMVFYADGISLFKFSNNYQQLWNKKSGLTEPCEQIYWPQFTAFPCNKEKSNSTRHYCSEHLVILAFWATPEERSGLWCCVNTSARSLFPFALYSLIWYSRLLTDAVQHAAPQMISGAPKGLGKFSLLFAHFLISLFSLLNLSLCVGLVGLAGCLVL